MTTFKKSALWLLKTVLGSFIAMWIFFFTALFIFIFFVVLAAIPQNNAVENAYLRLSFSSPVAEHPTADFDLFNLNKIDVSFYDLLKAVKTATTDDEVKGIYLDLDFWELSANQTNELKYALGQFKKSNKPVIAYATMIDNSRFIAALEVDCLAMPDSNSAIVSLTGYRAKFPYYKGLIDKVGMDVNVVHIGDFKAFGENYAHNKMSVAFRSELNKILNTLHVDNISAMHHKITDHQFSSKLENGDYAMITAKEALNIGAVDMLALSSQVTKKFFSDAKPINWELYQQVTANEGYDSGKGDFIALLSLEGSILNDQPGDVTLSHQKIITPKLVQKACKSILENPRVKGVVIRVNSPGGSALASEIIFQELELLKKELPVYVSMGSVAASGGYYISCHADKIFADSKTITGSIGVVSVIPNFARLTKNIGINIESISKGRYADLLAPTVATDPVELKLLERSMGKIYEEFTGRVSASRKISPSKLQRLAEGRVWTGAQAVENRLIDEVGGLSNAINQLASELDLKNYTVKCYPRKSTLFEKLLGVDLEPQVKLPTVLQGVLNELSTFQALSHQPLMILPTVPHLK